MSGAQKLKEGDEIQLHAEVSNKSDLLLFTDRCQVYKYKLSDLPKPKQGFGGLSADPMRI